MAAPPARKLATIWRGDLLRPRRDALGVDAVVAGEHRHRRGPGQRRGHHGGDAGKLGADGFQPPQRAGWLGEPELVLPRRRCRARRPAAPAASTRPRKAPDPRRQTVEHRQGQGPGVVGDDQRPVAGPPRRMPGAIRTAYCRLGRAQPPVEQRGGTSGAQIPPRGEVAGRRADRRRAPRGRPRRRRTGRAAGGVTGRVGVRSRPVMIAHVTDPGQRRVEPLERRAIRDRDAHVVDEAERAAVPDHDAVAGQGVPQAPGRRGPGPRERRDGCGRQPVGARTASARARAAAMRRVHAGRGRRAAAGRGAAAQAKAAHRPRRPPRRAARRPRRPSGATAKPSRRPGQANALVSEPSAQPGRPRVQVPAASGRKASSHTATAVVAAPSPGRPGRVVGVGAPAGRGGVEVGQVAAVEARSRARRPSPRRGGRPPGRWPGRRRR